jgi:hypothetical protein
MGNRLLQVLVFLFAGLLIRHLLEPKKPTAQQMEQTVIEAFKKASDDLNRQGPRMVDAATRLDSTEVGPGARFTYHYTFPNYSAQALITSGFAYKIQPQVFAKVCGDAGMIQALQYGGVYVYDYRSGDGENAVTIEVNKEVCSQPVVTPAS